MTASSAWRRRRKAVGDIDWDLAGPGQPIEDLAFVAWQWVPLWHPDTAAEAVSAGPLDLPHRLRILLDAYGLEDREGSSTPSSGA